MTQVVEEEESKATASLNFVGSEMEEFYGIILTHYFPFVLQLLSLWATEDSLSHKPSATKII